MNGLHALFDQLQPAFDPPEPRGREWMFVAGHGTLVRYGSSETPDADAQAALARFTAGNGARAFVLDGLYDGHAMAEGYRQARHREHLVGDLYQGNIDSVLNGTRAIVAVKWREVRPS